MRHELENMPADISDGVLPSPPTRNQIARSTRARTRQVCFVTGTHAEFGLMRPVLDAIRNEPKLGLQVIATGMHLDADHGDGLESIRQEGISISRVVPWESQGRQGRIALARSTALASAGLAEAFGELHSDIVLVTGDRVEAFAAASAAHLSGLPVAHVHGGDRAAGQVDDCLRHAITKLAHVHFPATKTSAGRIYKLGEDRWRIHRAGSPGLDGIADAAAASEQVEQWLGRLKPRRFALVILHPADCDEAVERKRAELMLKAISTVPFQQIVIIYPNNDPGGRGIMACWDELDRRSRPVLPPGNGDGRYRLRRDLPRQIFLGLLRDAAVLIGNSSSGIIEAASFGTPVLDIGPRQKGRERGNNVIQVPYNASRITEELLKIWNHGRPRRCRSGNIYGGDGAGHTIARVLSRLAIDSRLLRKLIRY